jgi:holin-like protein
MLGPLVLMLIFQLVGEAIVTGLGIPFPGPLCGMGLLLAYLQIKGGASERLTTVADVLVEHLGLLFVPAGAAIVTYSTLAAKEGVPILVALIVSTIAAVLISGLLASAPAPRGDDVAG